MAESQDFTPMDLQVVPLAVGLQRVQLGVSIVLGGLGWPLRVFTPACSVIFSSS